MFNVMPRMVWVVAGERGMELLGFRGDTDGEIDVNRPTIRVSIGSLKWTFTFDGIEGSGAVRVGPGSSFNPLQAVEALWLHLNGLESEEPIVLDEDMDAVEWTAKVSAWLEREEGGV